MEQAPHGKNPTLVRVIGGFKLFKALVLGAAAVGLLTNERVQSLFWRVVGFGSERALTAAGVLTAVYAVVFFVEGIGLLAVKRWAEWLTLVVTASFIPFEIWKLVHHTTAPGIVTLVLNLGIAAYLAVRRAQDSHHGALASRHALR